MTGTESGSIVPVSGPGFRPGSRRRARIAGGIAIAALAVAGNIAVYTSLDDSTEVLQFTANVHAGDAIEPGDVRVVAIHADLQDTGLVSADRLGTIVGQYARTFIPSRTLATPLLVRSTPLVSPGGAIVAVTPAGHRVPHGVIERSRVWLVLDGGDELDAVEARVVAIDDDGDVVLSVEVAEADAPTVAAADEIHVVLLDPTIDPAAIDPAIEPVIEPAAAESTPGGDGT